jgi:large subunit ribosomal protein L29
MRAAQLRDMPEEELLRQVDSLRESIFRLRVRATTKELTNTSQLSSERRDLARTLTILREKGLKV